MIYRLFLLLAIIFEITGTVSMKYGSDHGGYFGHAIMYIAITCSYICLAIAVKRIALGVAYALWEGVGALFITFFSIFLFDEPMSVLKGIGLVILLISIGLVESGSKKQKKTIVPSKSGGTVC